MASFFRPSRSGWGTPGQGVALSHWAWLCPCLSVTPTQHTHTHMHMHTHTQTQVWIALGSHSKGTNSGLLRPSPERPGLEFPMAPSQDHPPNTHYWLSPKTLQAKQP